MSLKGFGKAIVRAPQSLRQKLNMGENTVDAVYADAERRFKEIEEQTKRLSDESKRYHKAVNGMLDHQIGFSKAIEEIYKPISGRLSDPNSTIPEGNPEGIEACGQYREVVLELQTTLKPDLELIESKIVEPSQELLKVIQSIRKMATKRNHKQLDYDRRLNAVKKIKDKKEITPKDEERLYKAEAELEVAQQEFDYYNDMLKNELPILFQLQADFIKPMFISFYYMQLNIFYTLSSRMEEMKIPYFDLSTDIVEAYAYKKGDAEERAEAIGLTHFKTGYARTKLEATRRRHELATAGGAPGAYGAGAAAGGNSLPPYTPPASGYAQPAYDQKTPYGATTTPAYGQTAPAYGQAAAPAYGQTATPSPTSYQPAYGTPTSSYASPTAAAPAATPAAETCTALYDYTAQAAGDLSFTAGTVIEIVQRTADVNGWWTGRINGVQGVFPGNYVQLN